MEACWAHNPEVRRSKLRSAKKHFFQPFFLSLSFQSKKKYCRFSMKSVLHTIPRHVPLAQRIARWTSNPKVLGSIPRWDEHDFLPFGPLKAKSQLQALKETCQNGRVV